MKEFIIKNGENILVALEMEDDRYGMYKITAYDSGDMHKIGFINFKIKKGEAYLNLIKVEDSAYLQKGVGSVLLNCFERFCKNSRVKSVEGKFYPTGDGGDFAKDFYKRHGYEIYRECYGQYIFKYFRQGNECEKSSIDYSLDLEKERESQ